LASLNGHAEIVKILLDDGTNIAATNKSGQAAIHSASMSGHHHVVKVLVQKGADTSVLIKIR
jgi:uncharacterized protein